MEFRVVWEIDLTADTPEEAAKKAQAIMLDPDSLASVFTVLSFHGRSNPVVVDLSEVAV